MGRGKTTAMIRFMNEAPLEQRFLFITPYLEEVERIVSQCTSRNFKQPIVEGTKSKSLSWLIKHGCNVVLTHALFLLMDQETLDAAKTQGYTLIIDEELSAIEQIQVTPNDAGTMFEKYVLKDDTKRLTWTDENYKGIFEEYKERISKRQVYCYNEQYWLEILPPEYFTSFREVYVMTYRFQSQTLRCYFDLMQLSWSSLYVQGDSPEN